MNYIKSENTNNTEIINLDKVLLIRPMETCIEFVFTGTFTLRWRYDESSLALFSSDMDNILKIIDLNA